MWMCLTMYLHLYTYIKKMISHLEWDLIFFLCYLFKNSLCSTLNVFFSYMAIFHIYPLKRVNFKTKLTIPLHYNPNVFIASSQPKQIHYSLVLTCINGFIQREIIGRLKSVLCSCQIHFLGVFILPSVWYPFWQLCFDRKIVKSDCLYSILDMVIGLSIGFFHPT